MPVIDLSAAASDISGGGGGSGPTYEINALDYGLTSAADDSMAAANVVAIQDWADAISARRIETNAGVVGLIPPGRYVFDDSQPVSCVLPDMSRPMPLTVRAYGARFRASAAAGAFSMFGTGMPTSNTDAETVNGVRDMWTWQGGEFGGNFAAGQQAFDLNACGRMLIERVMLSNFDTGLRARFCLHLHIRDFRVTTCASYGIRIEEDNDWTGGTPSNAASNGTIIENGRFYGRDNQPAQVRIAHSSHTIKDCTFEGENVDIDVDFENSNTSCLSSSINNCHFEHNPNIARVRVNTLHDYEVDFQNITAETCPMIQVVAAQAIHVGRFGYPKPSDNYAGANQFFQTPAGTKWIFHKSGLNGEFDPSNAALWVGGVKPDGIYADGAFLNGAADASIFVSNYNGRIDRLSAHLGKVLIGSTTVGTQT